MVNVVNTAFLNIRNKPEVGKTIKPAMPKGQKLHLLKKSPNNSWREVSTSWEGLILKGLVASRNLTEAALLLPNLLLKESRQFIEVSIYSFPGGSH